MLPNDSLQQKEIPNAKWGEWNLTYRQLFRYRSTICGIALRLYLVGLIMG